MAANAGALLAGFFEDSRPIPRAELWLAWAGRGAHVCNTICHDYNVPFWCSQ